MLTDTQLRTAMNSTETDEETGYLYGWITMDSVLIGVAVFLTLTGKCTFNANTSINLFHTLFIGPRRE